MLHTYFSNESENAVTTAQEHDFRIRHNSLYNYAIRNRGHHTRAALQKSDNRTTPLQRIFGDVEIYGLDEANNKLLKDQARLKSLTHLIFDSFPSYEETKRDKIGSCGTRSGNQRLLMLMQGDNIVERSKARDNEVRKYRING